MNVKKICLISDTHRAFDDRIYWKEAVSLQKIGYLVYHLCIGDEDLITITAEKITVFQIKKRFYSKNRYINFIIKTIIQKNSNYFLFNAIKEIRADVYHVHDLKPLSLIRKIKKLSWKPKVIYCIRESYPDMIRDYNHSKGIFKLFFHLYAAYIEKWEKSKCILADHVVTIDDAAFNEFKKDVGLKKISLLYNYSNLFPSINNYKIENKLYDVIYVGGISKQRGLLNILKAIQICKLDGTYLKFALLGTFYHTDFKKEFFDYIKLNNLTDNIIYKDWIPHKEVSKYLSESKIGVVTLLPIPKFKKNIPIKQFEYMSFGLPVVGSNLPPIENFVKPVNAGIIVNPEDPKSIAKAFIDLINNKNLYTQLSKNGEVAAKDKYNWISEEAKLILIYKNLLN